MIWLTVEELLCLHKVVRERYPDTVSKGRINRGRLADIAEKPFAELYGQVVYDTIFKQAACLMEGIIRLHPFPDGNKRTALLATHFFLARNKHYMVVPLDAVRFMVEVAQDEARADGEIDQLIDRIAAWLQERTSSDRTEYKSMLKKHVDYPALKLFLLMFTGIGLIYAVRKIRYWFATDTHPEYAKNPLEIMKFLLDMTNTSTRMATKERNTS